MSSLDIPEDFDYSVEYNIKVVCKNNKILWFPKVIIDRYPDSIFHKELNGNYTESLKLTITLNWRAEYVNVLLNNLNRNEIDIHMRTNSSKRIFKYIKLLDYTNCFDTKSKCFIRVMKGLINDNSEIGGKYIIKLYESYRHLIPSKLLYGVFIAYSNPHCYIIPKDIFSEIDGNLSPSNLYKYINVIEISTNVLKNMTTQYGANAHIYNEYRNFIVNRTTSNSLLANRVIGSICRAIDYIKYKYPKKLNSFKEALVEIRNKCGKTSNTHCIARDKNLKKIDAIIVDISL
jgi:hypothetical protein